MNSSPTIIVINDQRALLRTVTQALKPTGAEVVAFECPLNFLQALPTMPRVDLIITDLNMPEMNGWELCARLRSPEFGRLQQVPVLVLSATFAGLNSTRVRLDLGVNDFMAVPFCPEQLRSKVQDILFGHCPKPRLRALFVGYSSQAPEVECFERAGYEVMAAVDLEGSLETLGVQTFEVLVYRGPLSSGEAQLLFGPSSQMVCALWVVSEQDPEAARWMSGLGVHCLPSGTQGEHMVRICEDARQRGCLDRVQELLEQRTQELFTSESRYRTLFQSIPDVVLCLSDGGVILDVNAAGCDMLGSSISELVGKNLVELVPEENMVQVQLAIHETLLYGYSQYESNFRCKRFELAVEIQQRKVELGFQSCVLAIARDISERQQCQQALLASDTRYRIIAENTHDWEFWLSPQGFFLFSSPSAEKVSGHSSLDFEDDPFLLHSLVVEEDRAHFERFWKLDSPADLPKDFEFRIRHPDGSVRWIHHVSVAVFDSQGNFLGSRGNHRDVTQRRMQEDERIKLVTAMEQVSDCIIVTDRQGIIQYVNQAFIRQNGSRNPAWVGVSVFELPGDDAWAQAARDIASCLARGESWRGSYVRTAPPTSFTLMSTVTPVRDPQGEVISCVWVERDITREQRLAEQLRQSQKLEAIGTLAGGIAHDFNNMLSGILGYSNLLKLQVGPESEVAHSAEVIERTARRAAELTQKLLGFARKGKNQHVQVCIHRAVQDCIELLSRTIDKRIEIVTKLNAPHGVVMGDPTQMEQVLLNLAINARDALEERGQITFATRTETVGPTSNLDVDSSLEPGDYLVLSVEDNGCGIPGELRERIFEPFFTTKEDGKGTGMGLPMVYGIIKNHGGAIALHSWAGKGTCFDVYLPLAAQPKVTREAVASPPVKGSGRILVVDDEELLRDVAMRFLTHLGYQVITAQDGIDAQSIYRERWQEIDLVLLDMMMPKVGGADCFRALKAINPKVRAILSTGYSLNETAQEMFDDGLVDFIQKPYQLQQLSEVLARNLKAPVAHG